MEIKEFISGEAKYCKLSSSVFCINKDGSTQHILDIRGWGKIQNLFKGDLNKSVKFLDKFGQWLADAINEKNI